MRSNRDGHFHQQRDNSDFNGARLPLSRTAGSLEEFELRRTLAGAHHVNFECHDEPQMLSFGLGYACLVRISNGSPVKAEGRTLEEAREVAARMLIEQLDQGTVIFGVHGKLEYHKSHRNKFRKR